MPNSRELESVPVPNKSSVISVKRLNLNQLFFVNILSAVKSSVISVKRLNLNKLFFENSPSAVKSNAMSAKRVDLNQINFVNILSSVKSNFKSKPYYAPRHGIFQIDHLLCHDSVNRSSKSSRKTYDTLMVGSNPLRDPILTYFNVFKCIGSSLNSCHEHDRSYSRSEL